jgi:hypothetical protein
VDIAKTLREVKNTSMRVGIYPKPKPTNILWVLIIVKLKYLSNLQLYYDYRNHSNKS